MSIPDPDRPLIDSPDPSILSQPSLPVSEAIARGASATRFDPERPISEEQLKAILHLATLASSDQNLQPWRFLLIRSKRNRERIWACVDRSRGLMEAPVALIVLAYQDPQRSDLEPMIAQQVRLGAISREQGFAIRSSVRRGMELREDPAAWAIRSGMVAAVILKIAAIGFGLASTLVERFDETRLREAFGVPNDHAVCCLVALGFAKETEPFAGRFGLGHVCFEEHFGQPWTLGEVETQPEGGPASDEPAGAPET